MIYMSPLKLENQSDIFKYLIESISVVTTSDPNALHTWIVTAVVF